MVRLNMPGRISQESLAEILQKCKVMESMKDFPTIFFGGISRVGQPFPITCQSLKSLAAEAPKTFF